MFGMPCACGWCQTQYCVGAAEWDPHLAGWLDHGWWAQEGEWGHENQGQPSAVGRGGKGTSPFGVAPRKSTFSPSISPSPPWPCLKRAFQCRRQCCCRQKDPAESSRWLCALLLKRKMCLDSLPNTTSASLCTSAGEAVQQGGEDGQTYQLTVWGPLSPLLPSSCRQCWKDDLPDVHLEHLWEMHSWDFPAVIEENHTLLAEKDWEKGTHSEWLNIFSLLLFLSFIGVFLPSWWTRVGEC